MRGRPLVVAWGEADTEPASRGYLEYYGQLRAAALPDRELFDAMVSRYPDWVSRQQFLLLGLG